jgi:phosphoglucomutase
VRPSGTEPKMKAYMAVKGNSLEDADRKLEAFKKEIISLVNKGF